MTGQESCYPVGTGRYRPEAVIQLGEIKMYVPPHFDESNAEVLHELMRKRPLGMLIKHGAAGLDANHIRFELDPRQGDVAY